MPVPLHSVAEGSNGFADVHDFAVHHEGVQDIPGSRASLKAAHQLRILSSPLAIWYETHGNKASKGGPFGHDLSAA
jgi:hypothetical protein